jgi:hypothetical protein
MDTIVAKWPSAPRNVPVLIHADFFQVFIHKRFRYEYEMEMDEPETSTNKSSNMIIFVRLFDRFASDVAYLNSSPHTRFRAEPLRHICV